MTYKIECSDNIEDTIIEKWDFIGEKLFLPKA